MLWGRRRTRVAAAAAVTAAALLLTGCSAHLDAGSAGANKLQAELGKIEGVRSVYTDGQNNLPFAGTASATVFTDDDLPDEKLQQVTDDVGRWVTSHRGAVTYSSSIDSDGFDFTVADRAAANKKTLAVVNGLRGDDRWLGAAIDGNNDSFSLDLQPKSPTDLLAAWTAVQAAAAKSGWSDTTVSASAWNKPGRITMLRFRPDFSVTGKDPSAEITAFQDVAAKHEVTAAAIEPGRLHLHVADAADVADATAISGRAAPETVAIIDGGIIRKTSTSGNDNRPVASDYAEADRLAAVAVRPGAVAINEEPGRLTVTASGTGSALAIGEALTDAQPAAPVVSILIGSSAAAADRKNDGLLLESSPAQLADAVQMGKVAADFLPARVTAEAGKVSLSGTVQQPSDAGRFAAAVKPVLSDGARFVVNVAGDAEISQYVGFAVTGSTITAEEPIGSAKPWANRDVIIDTVEQAWGQ